MTAQDLFREIGRVGDDLVEDAGRELPRRRWVLPAACAACAVIAVLGVWLGSVLREDGGTVLDQPSAGTNELPILTLDDPFTGSMGFEGVMAYDISEYHSGAPDGESAAFDTLPVFENPVYGGADFEAMEETLARTLELLGLDPALAESAWREDPWEERTAKEGAHTEEEKDPLYNFGCSLTLKTGEVEILVWANLETKITFDPTLVLPEEYRHSGYGADYDRMAALGEYLMETYPGLFSWMEAPEVDVQGGDYNFDGVQSWHLHVSDRGQTERDALVNSAFRDMWLCPDESGDLWIIWISWPDLTHVVGEYPVITAEEARELLLNGNYVTSVPYELPGESSIRRTELCYRKDDTRTNIPYYRFWVEVPSYASAEELGLHTYGAYYVPAVEGSYIANMPTYDGSFN